MNRVLLAVAFALLVSLLSVGASLAEAPDPLDHVQLQLKWKHQFQFAGYYLAKEKGFYRDAGLDVEIVEAPDQGDPVDRVISGKAEFGVGTTELLHRFASGDPVVVLAVIFQHSPLALAVRRDQGIDNIHQLAGKRVMIEPGSAEIFAMLAREDVGRDELTVLPHDYTPEDFITGKIDGMSVYSTDEPYEIGQAGAPYLLFSAREAGIDFYGDNLFTTRDQIEKHPERVSAFLSASLKGWKAALADPDSAIDLILSKYSSRKSREHLEFEAHETIRLIVPMVVEVGYMYPGRWRHIANTYHELGMLSGRIPLDGFLYRLDRKTALPWWFWWAAAIAAIFLTVVSTLSFSLMRTAGRLRQSEKELRGLIRTSPMPIVVTDRKSERITYVSDQACKSLGVTRSEAIGSPASDYYMDPGDKEDLTTQIQTQGGIVNVEVRFKRGDGQPLWALISSSRLDFEGEPSIFSAYLDLSKQKKMEADLRQALEEIRTLQEILPICMFCKKIRTDDGAWEQIDLYISQHSDTKFSHGLCPTCLKREYKDVLEEED
jgi:PAS domain S-box-containing protein